VEERKNVMLRIWKAWKEELKERRLRSEVVGDFETKCTKFLDEKELR